MRMNNNEYSIKNIEGKYYLYCGDEQVMTPEESAICTTSEELAKLLLKDIEQYGTDFENPYSIISYHAIYCDVAKDPDAGDDEENISLFTAYINMDPFWAFDEPRQVRAAALSQYVDWLPQHINTMPLQYYAAYMNLLISTESILLPYKIFYNILSEDAYYTVDDFDGLVEDLEKFGLETGVAEGLNIEWTFQSLKKMIETFVTYCSFETV